MKRKDIAYGISMLVLAVTVSCNHELPNTYTLKSEEVPQEQPKYRIAQVISYFTQDVISSRLEHDTATFTYDNQNRLVRIDNRSQTPKGELESSYHVFEYNSDNIIGKHTNRFGQLDAVSTYDLSFRLIENRGYTNGTLNHHKEWTYDTDGKGGKIIDHFLPTEWDDGIFELDERGNKIYERYPYNSSFTGTPKKGEFWYKYTYDQAQGVYPWEVNNEVAYEYGTVNENGEEEFISGLGYPHQYDSNGLLEKILRVNGPYNFGEVKFYWEKKE